MSARLKTARAAATFFYMGFLKPAPGTVASIAALPIALFLWRYGGAAVYSAVAAILGGLGYWSAREVLSDITAAGGEDLDPSYIVIDEVVGVMIACFLPFSLLQILFPLQLPALATLIAFRALDIFKPFNIGWIDKNIKGAAGVMLDDAAAGLYAGVVVTLIFLALA
jgi:phosphatidylglycerophosphatase A